jgi:hypothetical protein
LASDVNLPLVERLAHRMRLAIEGVPASLLPLTMSKFPTGSCGDACLLLGTYLLDSGLPAFDYVCGDRGSHATNTWTSHAWLASGGLIVDITADQFPDAPGKVIVSEASDWHKTFAVDRTYPSDFRVWSGYGTHHLHSMYSRLRTALFDDQPA